MKIAILQSSFDEFGGAERVIMDLASGLLKKGHQVKVFAASYRDKKARAILNSRQIPRATIPIKPFFDLSHEYKLVGWLIRDYFRDFDVINPHNHPSYIWAYYAKRYTRQRFPKKIIWTCHEPPKNIYPDILLKSSRAAAAQCSDAGHRPKWLSRWLSEDQKAVKDLDVIYCNSKYIQKAIKAIYQKEASPAYYGIDLNKWANIPLTPCPEKPTIVILSRLVYPKNITTILKAVALAVSKAPDLRTDLKINIGGTGPEFPKLKKLTADLKLDDLVRFWGFIEEKEIPAFFLKGSFCVFLPLDEAMGLIPMEAGLLDRATLGSDQGGVPEIIQDKVTGLLADPLNIDEIADKIIYLAKNRKETAAMGGRAGEYIRRSFNFDNFLNIFEKELQK